MANHLKVAMMHAIVTLHGRGWSNRRIARELGVDRGSVARCLAANTASGRGNPPLGSDADLAGVPAASGTVTPAANAASNPPLGSTERFKPANATVGPTSNCEPFREFIQEKLAQGLSGQRIYQDLAQERGPGGSPSYDSIKRFLRHLHKTAPLPFRRMEMPPGQEAQVDFGTGAPVVGAGGSLGKRRRTYVFRVVLSHSRKGYSEAVYQQTTEDFIACLENAFHALGGVPRTLVIDNLRAAVKHPDWYDPELAPRLEAFCRHYGTVILPTKSYTPRHKGKVERGIAYVKDNGLKGHVFESLQAQNQHLAQWELTVADTRLHGTTRQQVGKVFQQTERAALLPLPAERFPFFHEALRMVQRDGHVAVARAYYSAPVEYVGRRVWVRWDAHLVKLFNLRREPIAVHARQEAGRFATTPVHIHRHKTSLVEREAQYLLQEAAMLGSDVAAWSQAMFKARGIQGVRVLIGLLALARRYPGRDLNPACRVALSHQAYRLRTIRELFKDGGQEQAAFEFLESHPIIRGLNEYDALVRDAIGSAEPAACAGGGSTGESS